MVLLKYVFILLKALNELSEELYVAGITKSNWNNQQTRVLWAELRPRSSSRSATVGFPSLLSKYNVRSVRSCDSKSPLLRSS